MRGVAITAVALAAACGLVACGEKAQTAGQSTTKKVDGKPWDGTEGGAYAAAGWKAGDKAAWEAQLKARAERGQNEYNRTTNVAKPQ